MVAPAARRAQTRHEDTELTNNGQPSKGLEHGGPSHSWLSRDWRDWLGLAFRLLTGIVMLWAGLTKIGNLQANVQQVEAYQLGLPEGLNTAIGYAQPPLEIMVGVLLILGLFTRIASVLNALAMAVFIFGIAWAWSHGLRLDCGCFGDGGILAVDEEPAYLWDILRDLGLTIASVWLIMRPRTVLSVDGWLFRPLSPSMHDEDGLDEPETGSPDPSRAS